MSETNGIQVRDSQVLSGPVLFFAALILAIANFTAMVNMTIVNVALPTIAGNIGISSTQGTWIITFYAVAEAISVPLTGWLSMRFGPNRVFTSSMFIFGIASLLCGLSTSLIMLVLARVLQGFSGGLLMPLSQTLLLRVFPKHRAATANAIWAVTSLVAPVVGPILGGFLCDNYSWSWAFYMNVPITCFGSLIVGRLLWNHDSSFVKSRIDSVGLVLLIVWVTCLQIVLDEGKNLDWFASKAICALTVVVILGFISFVIWELTEENPIVDLRVFRHRGYSAALFSLVVTFGAYFGIMVVIPLWLQMNMGYTATMAGKTVAWMGVLAVCSAPIVAKLTMTVDSRKLVFFGISWIGLITLWLTLGSNDITYWDVALPFLVVGTGLSSYLVPVNGLTLSCVDDNELDLAAGLGNFARTLSGAFATSLTITGWEHYTKYFRAELSVVSDTTAGIGAMVEKGLPKELARGIMDQLIESQSMLLAKNRVLLVLACIIFFAALSIWIAPKPTRPIDSSRIH